MIWQQKLGWLQVLLNISDFSFRNFEFGSCFTNVNSRVIQDWIYFNLGFFLFICFHFPSSGNLHSILHCIALTQTKRLRKELKYILIHNNTLQSFVWSSIALKIHVSHFEDGIFLFVVSLQKWLAHFLLQKRWRNEGFKGTSDMPLYK